jgi:hypothetical protein
MRFRADRGGMVDGMADAGIADLDCSAEAWAPVFAI